MQVRIRHLTGPHLFFANTLNQAIRILPSRKIRSTFAPKHNKAHSAMTWRRKPLEQGEPNMTTHIVYFSAAGTTQAVAREFASQMEGETVECNLLRKPPAQVVELGEQDAALFAVPVYAGRVPAVCVNGIRAFAGNGRPAVAVVVYGNRAYDDALLELRDVLAECGFAVVAAGAFVAQHSIFPTVAAGRPDKEDHLAISGFARSCTAAFNAFASGARTGMVDVPGNNPYLTPKTVPLHPSADNSCTACGICARRCPVQAIPLGNPSKTDNDRCISCAACIATCPEGSRAFRGVVYAGAKLAFEKKNATRKEPETFFVG